MIGRRFRRLRLIVCLASNGPRLLRSLPVPRRVEGHVEAGKIARLPHPTT
jgi:hypothetical protein